MTDMPLILIVDDEVPWQRAMLRLLSQAGYRTFTAVDGQAALRLARSEKPDLILLDKALPDISGVEVCRQIKTDPALTGCVVVLVSGVRTDASGPAEDPADGADDYIARPISDAGLLARVRGLLRIKRAEDRLRESEERLGLAISAGRMGIWDRNFLTGQLNWSVECKAMFGLAPETEMNDDRFMQALHPEDRTPTDQAIRAALEQKTDFNMEYRVIWPDATLHWIAAKGRGYYNAAGEVVRMTGVTYDITERKRVEETSRESETRLRLSIHNMLEAYALHEAIFDEQGRLADYRFLELNPAAQRILTIDRKAIVGKTALELYPHVRERGLLDRYADVMATGTPARIEDFYYEGDSLDKAFDISCFRIDPGHFVCVFHDITDRKRAEQEHRAHLRFFENMDRVNRALQGAPDLEQMMSAVLETVLSIFDCDRAWLVYPCDPAAPTFRVSIEVTRPEYPDARVLNVDVPMSPGEAENMREALESDAPVTYTDGTDRPITTASQFGVRSQMFVPVYPRLGKPWVFGVHQCSYPRVWTQEEKRLFQEIGWRLTESLTSLLTYRDLQESEERFRLLFTASPDAILLIDPHASTADWPIVDCNDVACQMNGYLREELIGQSIDLLNTTAETRKKRAAYLDHLRRERVIHVEALHRHKDGHVFPIEVSTSLFTYAGRELVLGIDRDITERKQAEAALRLRESYLTAILENQPGLVWLKDVDSRFLTVNQAFADSCGQASPAELAGKTDWDIWSADFAEKYRADDARVIQNKAPLVKEELIFDRGKTTWFETFKAPIFDDRGNVIGTTGYSRDITERKQAEAALNRRADQLALLNEVGRKIVAVRVLQHVLATTARLIHEHFGYHHVALFTTNHERGELTMAARAGEFVRLFSPDHRLKLGQGLVGQAALSGELLLANDVRAEPRYVNLYGDRLPTQSELAVPLQVAQANVGVLDVQSPHLQAFDENDVLVIKTLADQIAVAIENARLYEAVQRHAAELEARVIERTAELADQREREHAILDALGEGVVFTDRAGTIEYINPAMERLTGFTMQESVGQNASIWQSGQTPQALYQQLWAAITRGETWQGELVNRHRDGRLYEAALTAAALTNPERQIVGFVGVQRDITRQKELDRLKDQFVSNVSHELRSPLTSIMLNLELVEHGRPEKRPQYLNTLRREAERLRRMIEDLLDISRLDRHTAPIELSPLDLHMFLGPLVADRAALAAERQLTLEFLPTAASPIALAEVSMLTQVISNLLTNALNYTPAGGSVVVQTHVQRAAGQDWLTMTVRDTGPGIAAHELPHLFERFYRGTAGRKASTPGTGLGLAISKEIIERLGGRITVESETAIEGRGSAFTVWLRAVLP